MESDDRALWDCLVALRERWITPNQFMEIIHGIDALCSFFALMPFPDTAEVGEVGIYGVAAPAPVAQKVPELQARIDRLRDDIHYAWRTERECRERLVALEAVCRRIVARRKADDGYTVLTVDLQSLEAMLAAAQAQEGK